MSAFSDALESLCSHLESKEKLVNWLKIPEKFHFIKAIQNGLLTLERQVDPDVKKKLLSLKPKKNQINDAINSVLKDVAAQIFALINADNSNSNSHIQPLLNSYIDYIPEILAFVLENWGKTLTDNSSGESREESPKNSPRRRAGSTNRSSFPRQHEITEKKDKKSIWEIFFKQSFPIFDDQDEPQRTKNILILLRKHPQISRTMFGDSSRITILEDGLLSSSSSYSTHSSSSISWSVNCNFPGEACQVWIENLLQENNNKKTNNVVRLFLESKEKSERDLIFEVVSGKENQIFSKNENYTSYDFSEINELIEYYKESISPPRLLTYFLMDYLFSSLLMQQESFNENLEGSKEDFDSIIAIQEKLLSSINNDTDLKVRFVEKFKIKFKEIKEKIIRIFQAQTIPFDELSYSELKEKNIYSVDSSGKILKENAMLYCLRAREDNRIDYSLKAAADANADPLAVASELEALKEAIVYFSENDNFFYILEKKENFELLMSLYEKYKDNHSNETRAIKENIKTIVKILFEKNPEKLFASLSEKNRLQEWCFLIRVLELQPCLENEKSIKNVSLNFAQLNNLKIKYWQVLTAEPKTNIKKNNWFSHPISSFFSFFTRYNFLSTFEENGEKTKLDSREKLEHELQIGIGKPVILKEYLENLLEGEKFYVGLREENVSSQMSLIVPLKEKIQSLLRNIYDKPPGLWNYLFSSSIMQRFHRCVAADDIKEFEVVKNDLRSSLINLIEKAFELAQVGVDKPVELNKVSEIFNEINRSIIKLDKKANLATLKKELESFKEELKISIKEKFLEKWLGENFKNRDMIEAAVTDLSQDYQNALISKLDELVTQEEKFSSERLEQLMRTEVSKLKKMAKNLAEFSDIENRCHQFCSVRKKLSSPNEEISLWLFSLEMEEKEIVLDELNRSLSEKNCRMMQPLMEDLDTYYQYLKNKSEDKSSLEIKISHLETLMANVTQFLRSSSDSSIVQRPSSGNSPPSFCGSKFMEEQRRESTVQPRDAYSSLCLSSS